MVMATVTETTAQMGVMGMVVEMVTVSLVVMVVVMKPGGVGESVEIQNSDGETTAVVVDIIGPAHMRPRLNGDGVWKGTHITEGKIAFGGYKDK